MIICGIDPGYDRAGYSFLHVKKNKCEPIAYGLISTNKAKSFEERIYELGQDVESLFQKYKPQHLIIEKLFMGKNTTTVLQVSEIRGVLCYLAKKHQIQITQIPPTTIKKTVSGYGAANKQQMIQAITLLLNLPSPPKPDDVADALAIAFCGFIKYS